MAIQVTFRLFAHLRELMGKKRMVYTSEHTSLEKTLFDLAKKYPTLEQYLIANDLINTSYVIVVNQTSIAHGELSSYHLNEGDEIAILPPAGGG